MKRKRCFGQWMLIAAIGLLPQLAMDHEATAGVSLYLNGDYNNTAIKFSATNSSNQSVTRTERGGGVVGGSLDGTPISYLYCLEWEKSVLVPDTYGMTTVSDHQIHGVDLPKGSNGTLDSNPAKDIAWLMVNYGTTLSTGGQYKQAGLQALLWSLVTKDFVLATNENGHINNNQTLIDTYNEYNSKLQSDRNKMEYKNFAYLSSGVKFITPSKSDESSRQGLVGYTPGSLQTLATPEPSTLLGAIIGLIPLAAVGIMRRRANRRERAEGDRPNP